MSTKQKQFLWSVINQQYFTHLFLEPNSKRNKIINYRQNQKGNQLLMISNHSFFCLLSKLGMLMVRVIPITIAAPFLTQLLFSHSKPAVLWAGLQFDSKLQISFQALPKWIQISIKKLRLYMIQNNILSDQVNYANNSHATHDLNKYFFRTILDIDIQTKIRYNKQLRVVKFKIKIKIFARSNQKIYFFIFYFNKMNHNHTKYIVCTQHIAQGIKRFKTIVNGQIKGETYLAYENNNQLKAKHIIFLRQTDQLTNKNTQFNPQVQCAKVQDQKGSPDSKKYLRLQSSFTNPSNLLDYLQLKKQKSKSSFDKFSTAEIIDRVIRKIILTLMTSSNYQLYIWQDIGILVDQNQDIEIQINKSAMTGMNFLLFGDEISFSQFSKIYEVVSIDELKQDSSGANLCYDMKIRAFAKILLTLLFQRYFEILQEIPDYKSKAHSKQLLTKKECLSMLSKRRDFFKTLLSNQTIINRIQYYQKYNNVHYVQFLREVFVEESNLTWSQVINKTIARNNVAELYSIKNQKNIQMLIKKLKYTIIDKKGNNHIQFFRKLGLYDDQYALLLALMHLQTSAAEQAISYADINAFLAISRSKDYMLKDELFKFLLKVEQGVIDFCIPIDIEQVPHTQKHHDDLRMFQVVENLGIQRQFYSPYLKQSTPIQVKQISFTAESDLNDSTIQSYNFLTALSQNLGQFTLKLRKTNFISQDYYSQGIRKYQSIFK